jgi:DNA-binding NtrC family response regulator
MEPANILVIDDEPAVCSGCRLVLKEEGHSVDVYMTGREGLDAIIKGRFDVVLLDLKLPDMDGMEILRTVRNQKRDEYLIVMTGYSSVENAVEAMKLGAYDYLAKPFTDDELVLSVEKAIEKKRLVEENLILRKELVDRYEFSNIVGENSNILRIFDEITKVAPTDCTVLLYGEHGTGKELFARAIHAYSHRRTRQFVTVDCSTLSPTLLESELFGHVKGAFTDAVQDRAGVFEAADGGTLFLDEVANLSLETQGKLLRVLETREYKPVGATQFRTTNTRVISASNQDLKAMVSEGTFREDLFYRLNVFPIFIPPLRERNDDIPKLAYHFLRHFCRKIGKRIDGFSTDALEVLMNYDWPGNVRQLKNVVERLVIMADGNVLDQWDLLDQLQMKREWRSDSLPETLSELRAMKEHLLEQAYEPIEKAFIMKALNDCGGNITRAAEKVGMKRPNFSTLMKKHHLSVKRTRVKSAPAPSK